MGRRTLAEGVVLSYTLVRSTSRPNSRARARASISREERATTRSGSRGAGWKSLLLEDGELPRLMPPGLEVTTYTEGWTAEGRHEARLVATARFPGPRFLAG